MHPLPRIRGRSALATLGGQGSSWIAGGGDSDRVETGVLLDGSSWSPGLSRLAAWRLGLLSRPGASFPFVDLPFAPSRVM